MINFSKFAVLNSVRHEFEGAKEYWWEFKPANSADELAIYHFLVLHPDASWIEVAWRELSLTFGGTNIPNEDEQPVLQPDAGMDEVTVVLRQLPLSMVVELWKALKEANPTWGPQSTQSQKEQ